MQSLTDGDPRVLGNYRVLALLGEGGMGRVYLAIGPDGQRVALKRILSQFSHDPGFRQRFAMEVEAARKVSGPHTVGLVDADADTASAEPWSATAFVPGPTLMEAVEAGGPLPEDYVRRLGMDLASALSSIHGAGLIHRDVKPSNVLLSTGGARLLDFGISRAMDSSTSMALTQTGGLIGSPGFMSPEQADSQDLTEKSDVFSLGCLLATAASGRAPFDGPSIPQILYKVVHGEPDLEAVPSALQEAVKRCLAKVPEERPSPLELRRLLDRSGPTAIEPPSAVLARVAEQESEIAGLLGAGLPQPTLVDDGPTMMHTRWVAPPAPERKAGLARPILATAVAATAVVLLIGLTVWVAPMLWQRSEASNDSSADSGDATTDAATTASDAVEATTAATEHATPPGDTEVSMSVPSIGAAATGLDDAWVPDLAYWQDWEPYAGTDVRSIPTADDSVGFIGIGVLDQSLVDHSPGHTGYSVEMAAATLINDFWGDEDDLWSSEVTLTEVDIDGHVAVLGEFRLEWEDPIGNGDTGAEYAIVLAELDDGQVFAGFLGLFDSQLEYYDEALEVLLAVTIDASE